MSDTPRNEETGSADKYAPRLPDAVRRAAARAEELLQEQQTQIETEAAVVGGTAQEAVPLPSDPEPEPRGGAPEATFVEDNDNWQSRYRTLQGKYDHEVPQMQMHIKQLEGLIATMQAAPRQEATPAGASPVQQQDAEIPEEDYTTYGPDFVDSARRWARAEVQRDLARQQQQIDELRSYANQTTGDRLKDRVRADLDRDPELTGRWQHLDTDPGFNAWLGDFDPFSGHRRLDMLREAYAGGDSVRTGRFFKAYLHEHTDTRQPPSAASQTLIPVTRPTNGNGHYGNGAAVDLTAYAAPGRASNATPGPGAPERRIWTNRDIQAFYEGRLKGRYRGREAEADRLERDILLAAQEGRVSQ